MPLLWIIIILSWILIVVTVWIYIRKHRPEWIGLGDDFNKQQIDGVRYSICPECSQGTLEPQFRWWQYFIGITLPPGIMYIVGNPYLLICSKCHFTTEHIDNKSLFTRISLTQKLSKEFFVSFGVNIIIGLVAMAIWFNI
jgi:hypothetical protein